MESCLININDSILNPNLRTFKLFKEEYKFENYLATSRNLNYASSLFRFRISSHNLRIETGRYTRLKTPENERKCLYCLTQAIETESHFLLNCDLYTSEREELLNIVIIIISDIIILGNDETFIMFMSNQDPVVTNALGKYIYNCLKKRSNTVLMSNISQSM